jgi:hypothetical protein
MGSLSIRGMNYVVGVREMNNQPSIDFSEMLAVMEAYRAKFGGEALRALYAAKGSDQATIAACREILAEFGGALAPALMNTSVAQNGGK